MAANRPEVAPAASAGPTSKEAFGAERVVEGREYRLLQRRFEVDEHVAAADEIESRIRRVPREIVAREHTHLADAFADLILIAHLREETSQALGGHIARDVDGIDSFARLGQRALAQIGRKNLERYVRRSFAEHSGTQMAIE